jgi:tight adherence protein B
MWVDGLPGRWVGFYSSPPAPARVIVHPTRATSAPSFWTSTLALVLVALISAVLLVGGLLVLLVPRARHNNLRARIGRFTLDEQPDVAPLQASPPGGWVEKAESLLEHLRWWPRFKEEVDIAAIERAAAEVLLLTAAIVLLVAALLSLAVGSPLITLPILLAAPPVVWGIIRARADHQRRLFSDQLPGSLDQVASAMRAGHSIIAAIGSMAEQAVDPTRREFSRALIDEQLGLPLEDALRPIGRRMGSSDVQQLALAATLTQRTGGSMAEVLELLADGARERADLRRELRTLTAQARMSRWIVTALPLGVVALLAVVRPSYLSPLVHTTAGIVVLCAATGLVVLGSVVMRLLVSQEV